MIRPDHLPEQCIEALRGIDPNPPNDGRKWCSATFDTVLCWPPVPAGENYTLSCPPLKGLDPAKNVTKFCEITGRWGGKNATDFRNTAGWTNYTTCFTDEVLEIVQSFSSPMMKEIQKLSQNLRIAELIGYVVSTLALLLVLGLYLKFRRLRFFRNMIHICTMIALLIVGITRLILFVDFMTEWRYVTNMPFVCELFFFVLEYGKICVVAWIFLETFYVHNRICWNLCRKESLAAYLGFGYLLPFINAIFWLFSLWKDHDFKMEKCLGSYYLRSMLILSVPKLITNTLTMIMLLNIARVLLCHYKNYVPTVEYKRIKIHIVIAFFLFLLVAIPEILHLFPLSLNKNTFLLFKIYSYTLTISMVLQGIIVAVIFLLLNKEVIDEFRDLSWRRKNSKIVLQNQTLTEYTQ